MQETVMSIRMMPISFAFNRMPRIVHDVSAKLNKEIELILEGETTEVDKTVMEKLTDPLVHIIRNSVDHGIEKPDVREANNKPRKGTVNLSAFHSGGNIVIQIKDDGAGIRLDKVKQKAVDAGILTEGQVITEKENIDLIFHAGFSTADVVTDISGRGVGMDVVRRNIRELGGTIEVQTEQGKGSVFTIRLPLTLAILDGQLAKIGDETYIFPLAAIVESVLPAPENIKSVKGKHLYRLRDAYLPIIRLNAFFNRKGIGKSELTQGLLVIVENGDKRFGVFVDTLESQQQVVIKSLDTNYRKVNGISGATIMGDGRVAMILDLTELASVIEV
jgi:two-component system chemotaxis sensor kinase CheA